jgi:signal peptidase I
MPPRLGPLLLSLAIPGLGAARLREFGVAAKQYALGFALIGILFLELPPRIACVSRYIFCAAVLAIGASYDAFRRAPDVPAEKRLDWRVIAVLAALHVVVVLPVTWLYIAPLSPFQISAHSMSPALQPGDFFMMRKRRWPFDDVARGDVVLFTHPEDPKVYVKRVVAVAGELVDACGYEALVEGQPLAEPYVKYRPRAPTSGCLPVRVPEGQVFVLGDNRASSTDSREHGAVPLHDVVGRAWFIFLASDRDRIGTDIR